MSFAPMIRGKTKLPQQVALEKEKKPGTVVNNVFEIPLNGKSQV